MRRGLDVHKFLPLDPTRQKRVPTSHDRPPPYNPLRVDRALRAEEAVVDVPNPTTQHNRRPKEKCQLSCPQEEKGKERREEEEGTDMSFTPLSLEGRK